MARLKVDSNPEPMVSVVLKYKKTLRIAAEVVKSRDKDYITPTDGEFMPMINKDGTPNDLVGAILTELGAVIPRSLNYSSVAKLRREGVIECDDDTKELLSIMQDAQDNGRTWDESVILAKCAMIVKDLPW